MKPAKLCIPEKILDQHLVMLGKTGAGKSSALRHIVEHLLAQKKRVCIVDPKGDWWGLKSSADGHGPGFPVIMFGDFKEPKASDVPINQHSGRHVAELITSGNRPCVIGFRGWMTSHMVQFWIDFASGIFNANSGELFIVGDEFHNFAPKGKIMDPQAGKCLHWSNRLLSEGRGLGIVCLLASQRPQKVHNDTLTSCETLIAMRVVHAADRGAVEDWIKGCGDKERGKEVLNSLAGMGRGEAFVWSPEIDFGPKHVKFPMFTTFDSFAPPQLQKKVDGKGWADVDLDAVREKLAAVIEKAKAEDPKELQRQISDLKKQLKHATPAGPVMAAIDGSIAAERRQHAKLKKLAEEAMQFIVKITADETLLKEGVDPETIEKAAKKAVDEIRKQIDARFESQRRLLENYRRQGARLFKDMEAFLESARVPIDVNISKQEPVVVSVKQTTPQTTPVARSTTPIDGSLPTPQQRIVDAIAWLESIGNMEPEQTAVAFLAGYTVGGGAFNNPRGALRTAGLIDYRGTKLALTEEGRKYANTPDTQLTSEAMHQRVLERLPGPERKLLQAVIEAWPDPLTDEELAERTGYSVGGGAFNNPKGRLRTLGLVFYPAPKTVIAAEILFPGDVT